MVDEPLFGLTLSSAMSAERLGEIESELERMLTMVSAARAALIEFEAARPPADTVGAA